MNPRLAYYCVAVQHPAVSGAEHLELLQLRDQLVSLEPLLTPEEQEALGTADALLAAQASQFHQELQRFVNLATYRHEQDIPPERWWWYLDVLQHVPRPSTATSTGA